MMRAASMSERLLLMSDAVPDFHGATASFRMLRDVKGFAPNVTRRYNFCRLH